MLMNGAAPELGSAAAEAGNPAKRLAREVAGPRALPSIAAPGGPGRGGRALEATAQRNAKVLAHSSVVPEHNHNEIVGWQLGQPGHAVDRGAAVAGWRGLSRGHSPAGPLTAEYAARQGAAVHEIRSQGESRIARLASLVQFGDSSASTWRLLGGWTPPTSPASTSSNAAWRRARAHASGIRRAAQPSRRARYPGERHGFASPVHLRVRHRRPPRQDRRPDLGRGPGRHPRAGQDERAWRARRMVTTGLAVVARRDHHRRRTSRSRSSCATSSRTIGYDDAAYRVRLPHVRGHDHDRPPVAGHRDGRQIPAARATRA